MNWFVTSILCIIGWGCADLFYKKGTDETDRYSHLRIAAWVGLVMGIAAVVILILQNRGVLPAASSGTFAAGGLRQLLRNMVAYAPASIFYILSMVIGYAGLRYLEISVVSPVQNASGGLSVVLMAAWLFARGKGGEILENVSVLDIIGTLFIVAATIGLAVVEQRLSQAERGKNDKYRLGALALSFPLLYCLFDALGTAADGVILSGNGGMDLTEWDVLVLYGLTFFAAGVCCFLYLWIREGRPYRMFAVSERPKACAALFEECGQVFYVFAMAENPMAAAPLVASYCIVSVILSHLFLRERLKAGQYACVAAFIVGIVLLGISEGLAA